MSAKTSSGCAPPRPLPGAAQFDSGRAREDRALFERYHDQRDAVDRAMLVERFLPLARRLASRYRSSDEPFDDLFQVACLGLVKAIDRFDLDRGIAFSSFAVPTILGELKRYFRDRTWSVRVPRDLQELSLRVERAVSELVVVLHRQPTVAEVAARVGATDEEVLEALHAAGAYKAASLEAPRGDHDSPGDTLGDAIGIEDSLLRRAEDRVLLAQLMRRVTAREREVLLLRFVGDLTQREIGQRIGLSQMQVSRIIRQGLTRLQTTVEKRGIQTLAA